MDRHALYARRCYLSTGSRADARVDVRSAWIHTLQGESNQLRLQDIKKPHTVFLFGVGILGSNLPRSTRGTNCYLNSKKTPTFARTILLLPSPRSSSFSPCTVASLTCATLLSVAGVCRPRLSMQCPCCLRRQRCSPYILLLEVCRVWGPYS